MRVLRKQEGQFLVESKEFTFHVQRGFWQHSCDSNRRNQGGIFVNGACVPRWVMKIDFMGRAGILTLAISGLLSLGAWAQTTDPGPGPSEQPDASMEVGQTQPDYSDQNAQPTEAQPGGPSG